MKCLKCGMEVPSDSSFCQYCGIEIPKVKRCSYCYAELSDDMKFCAMCGKQILPVGNNASKPANPTFTKKKNSGRSISKKLFVVVSCVCVIAVVCACVFGCLYRKNYNTAIQNFDVVESLRTEKAELEAELAQLDAANAKLRSTNEILTDRISELNEVVSTNSKKADFCDEYLVFVPKGSNMYHKYDCEKWAGTFSIYASWQLDNLDLRACPYCH